MTVFDDALDRLDRYIWYMAHQFGRNLRGVEVSDLHQLGLMKLYEVYSSERYSGKNVNELDAIFKQSLYNMYVDTAHKSRAEAKVINDIVDLDAVSDMWGYNAFDDMYVSLYQEHMTAYLSRDAAVLLEHLLHPTPAIYHMHNIQRMRREALQQQGRNVRVPKKITQETTGKTLGFSASHTKALIRELRQVWQTCQTNRWTPLDRQTPNVATS